MSAATRTAMLYRNRHGEWRMRFNDRCEPLELSHAIARLVELLDDEGRDLLRRLLERAGAKVKAE